MPMSHPAKRPHADSSAPDEYRLHLLSPVHAVHRDLCNKHRAELRSGSLLKAVVVSTSEAEPALDAGFQSGGAVAIVPPLLDSGRIRLVMLSTPAPLALKALDLLVGDDADHVEEIFAQVPASELAYFQTLGFAYQRDARDPLLYETARRIGSRVIKCVDAFALPGRPFSGNPAAVCVGHGPEAWQQGLAQELNLSETAFVSFPASPSPSLGASRSPLERVLACACAQVELSFADVTTAIRSAFSFDPAASFSIGALASAKGQNLGSLHVMAVTKAFKLNRDASARLWGEHLASVLKDPAGDAHPNIRSFLGGGEVVFLDGAGNVADSPIVGFDAVGLASLARHGCSLLGARLDAARALVRATASEEDKNDTWADCVSLYLQSMRLENTTFESSGAQVSLLDSLAASETSALRPLEGDVVPSLVAESLRAGPGGIQWAGIARCISQHVDIADDLAAQQPGLCVGALTVSRAQHPESWLALNFADLMGLDVRATLTLLATYPISAQDRGVCLGALRRTRAFSRPPTSCFTLKPPVASHKPPSFASHVDTLGLRPTVEVDLCGHATLAAAHVLFTTRGALLDRSHVVFDTRGGKLSARRLGSGMVELDFPALMPELKGAAPGAVALALGLDERDVLEVRRNAMDSLALLREGVRLERLQPDMGKIRALGGRGLIVTAAAAQQPLEAPGTPGAAAAAHFTSRFFAPNAGIQEDPVTGSAHCALAPFWAQRLGLEPGAEMLGLQLSARRGCVYVANTSDGRVKLRGVANDVWSGTVRVPGSLLIEQI